MNRIFLVICLLVFAAGCTTTGQSPAPAEGPNEVNAGEPAYEGKIMEPMEKVGVDLIAALKGRHSTREFDNDKKIPDHVLSTILWAADGVNRANGKHTSPSAMGMRYMRIYVCRADGAWRYDQDNHKLLPVTDKDIRPTVGRQPFMAEAQAVLILASDLSVFEQGGRTPDEAKRREWSCAVAGCIAQNVYLTAEALGLGTVMAAGMNADEIRKELSLPEAEVPLFLMPLGYPKAK